MRVLYFTCFIVFFDHLTKLIVKGVSIPFLGINFEGMPYGSSRQIIGDFVRLTYIENPGMAFGIELGEKLFIGIISIIACIVILLYLYKVRTANFGFRLSLATILGGAFGNLIDRVFYGLFFGYEKLFYGRVVDFIDIDFFNINIFGYYLNRWPVFNIADAAVSIGVILLLIYHKENKITNPLLEKSDLQNPAPESVDLPSSKN